MLTFSYVDFYWPFYEQNMLYFIFERFIYLSEDLKNVTSPYDWYPSF